MKTKIALMATAAAIFATGATAHPGGGMGVGMGMGGPPASVTMGPPAAALSHVPNGVPLDQPVTIPPGQAAKSGDTVGGTVSSSAATNGEATDATETEAATDSSMAGAASLLGKLNAAHASPTALAHANSHSIVGAISTYKNATQTAQANVTKYTALVSQDQATVATDTTNLTNTQNNLTTLQKSGTATQQQLTDAQTAVTDAQNALNTANMQLQADQTSLNSAQTAIVSAQNALAVATNKPLTPTVISQLNTLLGI